MGMKLWVLAAVAVLALAGCGKAPPVTGSGAYKLKDPVWVTYGWSKGRMAYIIYFVPNPAYSFNPDGVAATVKMSKEADVFEGALDGYMEKSKAPYRSEPKKGETTIDGRGYRGSSVFLVNLA